MASSICHHSPPYNPAIHRSFPCSRTPLRSFHVFKHTNAPPSTAIRCSLRRPEYIPNHIPDPKYVRIFDTTLRDGEQSPGATMTTKEKLDIARQLARLGVDVIEAGFPASSDADFEAVKLIACEVGNVDSDHAPVICGLSRCNKRDIDRAWEAVKFAKKPRIHTFIATSEIHMQFKLQMTPEQVIEKARSMVAYARSLGCEDIEFSPEDAGRSDREFLYKILGEVIKAGATTLNIPDTVGYTLPIEFGQLIADIKSNTPGIENVIISTHCQNDLGLSTANTLAGAHAGARQLEVTINGIGERAGNASLEEVVMALKCRGEQVLDGLYTGINTHHIIMASKMVEEYSGLRVQPHKAIVGANAFAHESGIHQGHKQWLAEVQFLGVVDHPNLVKLIGYCGIDGERGIQRLLVYEYMPNKSLEDHLFSRVFPTLSWDLRLQIMLGAAKGLAYLHQELEIQVIYRDFKASNVLLDDKFNPKLSDFGLAREGPDTGFTHVSTAVVGTYGYAAPDYVETGHLTSKSDVWSFGVVLYEILTGRRSLERARPKSEQKMLDWVKQYPAGSRKFRMIVDPRLGNRYSLSAAREIAKLADSCLVKNAKDRPEMSKVVETLKHVVEVVGVESPPGKYSSEGVENENYGDEKSEKTRA